MVGAFLALGVVEVFFPGGAFGDWKLVDALSGKGKRGWVCADDGGVGQEGPSEERE